MLEVDVFVSWDDDRFLLFISPERRANLPTRGMETKFRSSAKLAVTYCST